MTVLVSEARIAVQRARRRGELLKRPCELCGRVDVDAHHEDYSKPLAVVWLCRRHHVWLHQRGLNAAKVAQIHAERCA